MVPTTPDVGRPRVPASSVPGKPSPLVHVNGSDLCRLRVGTNLTARIVTIWYGGKSKINRFFGKAHESTRSFPFPYEIVEMIIAHLVHNFDNLKACSLTCRSWYSAAAPLLHHTLTLTGDRQVNRIKLELLPELHNLGLMPLVKQIQVLQFFDEGPWFVPQAFSHPRLHYFSAFTNVQSLTLDELDIYLFIPGIERYFEHFSPTLRSITLFDPHCTPRQLSHFLSLFTNLDNVEIRNAYTYIPDAPIPETEVAPLSQPKLRGRLLLSNFSWVETWTHLITPCGGLRFRYINLRWSTNCARTLLEACAETLEVLRLNTTDSEFFMGVSTD